MLQVEIQDILIEVWRKKGGHLLTFVFVVMTCFFLLRVRIPISRGVVVCGLCTLVLLVGMYIQFNRTLGPLSYPFYCLASSSGYFANACRSVEIAFSARWFTQLSGYSPKARRCGFQNSGPSYSEFC